MIILDYETRSKADLPKVGAYNYALDPTTDIICLALLDEQTNEEILIYPPRGDKLPQEWVDKLTNTEFVGAVNATFDRLIHSYIGVDDYDLPPIPFDKWYCISSQLRVNALPANLEDGALAAKVANLKNQRGKELIKLLSIPQADGTFNECPKLQQEMGEYCLDDVRASVDVYRACRKLTPTEHIDWLACERMNENGVKIDVKLAKVATQYAQAEQADIAEKITEVTNGAVTKPTQYQRIKKYINDAVADSKDENDKRLLKLMTTFKQGKKSLTLDKQVRENVITAIDEGTLNLYEDIEELIRLLDAASASSVAKFAKMLDLADVVDDRVRGAFVHAGASQTHRFSSKGLQLHNMKRKCFGAEETEEIYAKMSRGEEIPNVMNTLSKLLRPALVPDRDHSFVVGDWSAIEARVLPWLSGDDRAEVKLNLFRAGVDVYIEQAKSIYNRDDIHKDSDERQVGKIADLSLGYGGANGAFISMANNYGVFLPDAMVTRIVKAWRRSNKWAVDFWAKLEDAAKKAIRKRGEQSFSAGRVTYHYVPNMLGGTLVCELPDGTFIQYPFARIEYTDRGDNIVALRASIKPSAKQTASDDENKAHWGQVRLWGGLLSENISQAFSAALLRNAIRNLKNEQDKLVAHVHDELILEVPTRKAQEYSELLKTVMETTPDFAEGLPLKASPVILTRYGNH